MKRDQRKRRLQNLIINNPHCHWCGVKVVYFLLPRHITMPDNFATLDHLNTKYNPEIRQSVKPGIATTVLACHACNQRRCEEETQQIAREELWKRANSYPQGHPLAKDYRSN